MSTTINHSVNSRADADAMDDDDPEPEVLERARPPRQYSAKFKARFLEEYERLDKAGKGALLRREGLYSSLISEWRKQRDRGALTELAKPAGRPAADPRDRAGRDEMTDAAICELAPIVGVRDACAAVGEAQARWYRRHRQSPVPPKA